MESTNTAPDYKHGNFLLASTNILNYEYADFVEYWNDYHEDEPIPDEESSEFWDWAAFTRDAEWEIDLYDIEECEAYNIPVVLTGSSGRWDGRHSYIPRKFNSIIEAVKKIISGGCDDYDIHFNDGAIVINGHHHDGTNRYELHALSKKGLKKVNNALDRYEDIPELQKWDLKRLPYLYACN